MSTEPSVRIYYTESQQDAPPAAFAFQTTTQESRSPLLSGPVVMPHEHLGQFSFPCLRRAYVDGLYSDDDYKRQKRELEDRLAGLVVPEADAARAAGEMLQDLPRLWSAATRGRRPSRGWSQA